MSTSGELACTYAIMILHDDGIPITAEKIATLVKKANVQCESYWPGLFAKFTEKKNVEDLITNVSATGGSGAAAVAVSASAGGGAKAVEAPAAEEKKKKEEEKEESDDDGMIMNLFD